MGRPSVSFVSLGCAKNLVDSEKMLGLLAEAGCAPAGEGAAADVVVVNTCGFLSASREEALGVIREAAGRKRAGEIRRLVVAGCLVQRDGQRLAEEVPEIDALVGVNNRRDIVRAVVGRAAGRGDGRRVRLPVRQAGRETFISAFRAETWSGANREDRVRLRLTPAHFAYVRISEGCDQKCTFCTIPSIRGPMHCKTPGQIAAECRELIADGAVEINLIGQDTTNYGRDIGEPGGLAGLLRRLDRLDGLRWLRLMYVYPTDFSDEMIDAIAACERVVKYIDIPLQHISDRILKAMHRRIDRRGTEALLEKLRRRIPGVAIRTTFIAGFPAETEAELEELCEFVRGFGFDAMGVFPFSREPETPAGRMKGQIDEPEKQRRAGALMEIQQAVAFRKAAALKGRTLEVMIDGFGRDGEYPARHAGQAPEIDSVTYVKGGDFDPGAFVRVRVTGRRGYDLVARPAGELRGKRRVLPLPVLR